MEHAPTIHYIDVYYHQIRDLRKKKLIKVQYCPSDEMLADLLTWQTIGQGAFLEIDQLSGT